MQAWQEVIRTALVGVDKQKLDYQAIAESESGTGLGAALAQLAAAGAMEPERRLLEMNSLLSVYRRAGQKPGVMETALPPAAAEETRRSASSNAVQDLLVLLSDTRFRELLPEWLQLAADQGQIAPPEVLPDLLDFGRSHSEVRDAILPVLGERGRWLAAQHSDWKYALQISLFEIESETKEIDTGKAEESWQTGTRQDRVALLQKMRPVDPDRTRALIESTWAEDAPEDRAAFIAPLRAGLSMADEPLLESALDDRRKEVRSAAQELLVRLPESRLCRRMWERAEKCVRLASGPAGRETLEITLPEACDKAMARDGITQKPSWTGQGEKSWWLQQILECVPPLYWSQKWNRPAGAFVAANRDKDWSNTVLFGWMTAVHKNPDSEWATALFNQRMVEYSGDTPMDAEWTKWISREVFETGMLRLMNTLGNSAQNVNPLFDFLESYPKPWSRLFAAKILDYLRTVKGQPYYIAGRFSGILKALPDELKAEGLELWRSLARSHSYMQSDIETYLAAEEFRKEMRRKIMNG